MYSEYHFQHVTNMKAFADYTRLSALRLNTAAHPKVGGHQLGLLYYSLENNIIEYFLPAVIV